jgi:hypothetical protein
MDTGLTTTTFLTLAFAACASAPLQAASAPAHLREPPLIMRLSNDEFRIAFGIDAPGCAQGCSGVIRYRVDWRTEDGALISEYRRVGYSVAPHSRRTLTVDRQYFDTAEGAHRVEVVQVRVAAISCSAGLDAIPRQLAALNPAP